MLTNQGKDLYIENPDEYTELQKYRIALYHHIFGARREPFALLMENLVHDSIGFEDFEIAFSRLWRENLRADIEFQMDLKRVENLQFDLRSDGFGSWITAIFRQFDVLEDEECTEQEVRDYVRNTLREIQPYL